MNGIARGSFVNRDNDRIVSMDEYAKLLDASPNQEWRTIIALARIGGLRCPTELQQLRWSDVDWEQNRFVVRSPKTERHASHQKRIVPLFSELQAELERSAMTVIGISKRNQGKYRHVIRRDSIVNGSGFQDFPRILRTEKNIVDSSRPHRSHVFS